VASDISYGPDISAVGQVAAATGAAGRQREDKIRQEELELRLLGLAEQQRQFDLGLEARAIANAQEQQRYQDQLAMSAMRDRRLAAQRAADREAQIAADQRDFMQQAALAQFSQEQQNQRQSDQQAALMDRLNARAGNTQADLGLKEISDHLQGYEDLQPDGQALRDGLLRDVAAIRSSHTRPDAKLQAVEQLWERVQNAGLDGKRQPPQPGIDDFLRPKEEGGLGQVRERFDEKGRPLGAWTLDFRNGQYTPKYTDYGSDSSATTPEMQQQKFDAGVKQDDLKSFDAALKRLKQRWEDAHTDAQGMIQGKMPEFSNEAVWKEVDDWEDARNDRALVTVRSREEAEELDVGVKFIMVDGKGNKRRFKKTGPDTLEEIKD
jgi:hypothetical protein